MGPCVLKGHLSVVSQDVPGGSIIDRHRDETLPIKPTSSVADACKEDGQVVCLTIEFLFKGRDGLVVQFSRHRSSAGVEEQYLQFWATLDDGQVWSSKISAY